jgi:hypothetical protein
MQLAFTKSVHYGIVYDVDRDAFDRYLEASARLRQEEIAAGYDPDEVPVCICGRVLCRLLARGEQGHAAIGG